MGWARTGPEAIKIAERLPEVQEERARHPGTKLRATPRLQDGRWEVSVLAPDKDAPDQLDEVAYVLLEDRSGRVLLAWTGPQVAWPMARGYPGAFGGVINAPWVWGALSLLFLAPFVRGRLRLLHLDVVVLLGFGASYAYFNAANLDVSVPSVYPLLAYLLARMLWVAWRGAPGTGRLIDERLLFWGLIFLVGFRVAVSVTGGNVIDVGYSGVIGADRITHGAPLYGAFPLDNEHGDTYGPVLYGTYVPWS